MICYIFACMALVECIYIDAIYVHTTQWNPSEQSH